MILQGGEGVLCVFWCISEEIRGNMGVKTDVRRVIG